MNRRLRKDRPANWNEIRGKYGIARFEFEDGEEEEDKEGSREWYFEQGANEILRGIKRLFIVHTYHDGYDETGPYIVIADTQEEAKGLVESNESFIRNRDTRRRMCGELPWSDLGFNRWGDYRYGIKEVEEVPLTESKVLVAIENLG